MHPVCHHMLADMQRDFVYCSVRLYLFRRRRVLIWLCYIAPYDMVNTTRGYITRSYIRRNPRLNTRQLLYCKRKFHRLRVDILDTYERPNFPRQHPPSLLSCCSIYVTTPSYDELVGTVLYNITHTDMIHMLLTSRLSLTTPTATTTTTPTTTPQTHTKTTRITTIPITITTTPPTPTTPTTPPASPPPTTPTTTPPTPTTTTTTTTTSTIPTTTTT